MSKKIIITGGAGYLGSVVVPYLREHGYDTIVFDTGFFADALLYPVDYPIVKKDARDITAQDIEGAAAVVHLAAMSNDPFGNLTEETVYGATRTYARNIALLAKAAGAKFIFASSCSVYGAGAPGFLTEDGPTNPLTPYSRNKLEIEQDLATLADGTFHPIALRFATAFGLSPRIRFDLVVNMLAGMAVVNKKIVLNSDGRAWRPYVHVRDIAESVRRAIEHTPVEPKLLVLNVGRTSENHQVLAVAEMVRDAVAGSEIVFLNKADAPAAELIRDRKIQDGVDKRTYQVSFERIGKIFPEFAAQMSVKDGIREMAGFFTKLPLTREAFARRGFYRLQAMEDHFAAGRLTPELRWK